MTKAIDIPAWQSRISRAQAIQSAKWREWQNNIDFYTGDWFKNNVGIIDPDLIEVSFVFSYIKTIIPAIYFKDPKIFVRPRPESTGKFQPFAETMEEVINYIWSELRVKKSFRKALLDAILTPPGWLKIGYTAQFDEDVAKVSKEGVSKISIGKIISGLLKSNEKTPEEAGILTGDIREESVFVQHISSWRMLLAPGYHDIEHMPYLTEIEDVALEDFYKNKFYKKSKMDVKPGRSSTVIPRVPEVSGPIPRIKSPYAFGESQEANMVRLFHVWDRRNQIRFTLAENFTDDTMFDGDWPYAMDGFIHYPIVFNEVPQTKDASNAYPVSDIKSMTPQLIELSKVRTQMSKHRKRSGTVVFVRKGLWTSDEIDGFETSEDMTICEVTSLDQSAFQNYQPPKLPEDVYKINDVILQDLMRESGLMQLLASEPQKGIETLGEARILQVGSELRTSDKVEIAETVTVDVARGLASLVWEFYDRMKISEITGVMPSQSEWPDLPEERSEKRRIIQAELNFRIDAGSMRPPMDEFVEQKLWQGHMTTIKTLFPNLVDDEVLLTGYLKQIGFKDFEKAIRGMGQQEIEAAQAENELLSKNIPQIVSPNERHDIHMPIHMQAEMTEANKIHIMEHNKFSQMKGIRQPGQGGNASTQMPNTPNELKRTGTPAAEDLIGSVQNMGGGLGSAGPT